jgi:hypothetical protein
LIAIILIAIKIDIYLDIISAIAIDYEIWTNMDERGTTPCGIEGGPHGLRYPEIGHSVFRTTCHSPRLLSQTNYCPLTVPHC